MATENTENENTWVQWAKKHLGRIDRCEDPDKADLGADIGDEIGAAKEAGGDPIQIALVEAALAKRLSVAKSAIQAATARGITPEHFDKTGTFEYGEGGELIQRDWVQPIIDAGFAVVNMGGAVRVQCRQICPDTGQPKISFLSPGDFALLFAHRAVPSPRGPVAMGEAYLKHPRRAYFPNGAIYAPYPPGKPCELEGAVNLFLGFPDWSNGPKPVHPVMTLEYLREVPGGGDEIAFDYILLSLAFLVQFPEKLWEIALVIVGLSGSGKTFFAKIVGLLVGAANFRQVSSVEHLTGRFAGLQGESLVIHWNDVSKLPDAKAAGILRAMITDDRCLIEPKWISAFSARNHCHLIITSELEAPVQLSLSDRRYVILPTGTKYQGNTDFFGRLWHALTEGGELQGLLEHLKNMDLKGFHPRDIPAPLRLNGWTAKFGTACPSVIRWWFYCLGLGYIPSMPSEHSQSGNAAPEDYDWPLCINDDDNRRSKEAKPNKAITTNELLRRYHVWCETWRIYGGELHPTRFGQYLREFGAVKKEDGRDYKPARYHFRSLQKHREIFMTYANIPAAAFHDPIEKMDPDDVPLGGDW